MRVQYAIKNDLRSSGDIDVAIMNRADRRAFIAICKRYGLRYKDTRKTE